MISQQIRSKFLAYFHKRGHEIVPSSSVVPHDDPTLLFVNAGMNQFKDVFLGKSLRDYKRATSSQKCIRVGGKHNDLENVGHTDRHLTFFEMLGNFSFGDYFKEEAIAFAWEVTLEVYGFDPHKLWITVLHDDEETFEIWKKYLPESRIVRMSEKDNFWAMGDVGPCGPCTELYYDKGEGYGHGRSPAEDVEGSRFLEFWNLVFMQFNRETTGVLHPLKKKGVDTGSGLERVCAIKEGVSSLFETDVIRSLIRTVEQVSKVTYKGHPAFRVIADHFRSLAFAIADGVIPSNIERGYVLRKILRRAVRYGRQLNLNKPFLAELFPTLLESMGTDFPELKKAEGRICEIITSEEEAFLRTLKRGGNLLGAIMEHSKELISGEDAFKLKDTYGLPLEEILLLAKDANLNVDITRFEELEFEAKEKSKGGVKKAALQATLQSQEGNIYETYAKSHKPATFLGYGQLVGESTVLGLIKEGKLVLSLSEGEEGIVLLDETPFYAEKGGQVGDTGFLSKENVQFEVTDTTSPYTDLIAHHGVVKAGELRVGERLNATVDARRRQKIANNHTATHLLQEALVCLLGPHIKQAGSIVEAHRLRFDFTHHKSLSPEEISKIEAFVNEKVRSNAAVCTFEIPYMEAQKRSDILQNFGEKYGKMVRVVEVGSSKELCGGTHTQNVGTIGYFRIVKEGSISAGIRRIEAVTADDAEAFVMQREKILVDKFSALLEENRKLILAQEAANAQKLENLAVELLRSKEIIQDTAYIGCKLALSPQDLKTLADILMAKMGVGVIFLCSSFEDKCHLIVRVSEGLPLNAGMLMQTIVPLVGGKGGGKAHFAQGGGTEVKHLDKVLTEARQWILSNLS